MKFVKSADAYGFITTWTNEDNGVRVMADNACSYSFYKYQVQKFNGKTWDGVQSFHTLKEAKVACETI